MISKSTSGGTLCVFGSHTFVPISWMCKKQTAVSHSSTESEIISLDTGLRLDGFPALELWDLIVSVLGNISRFSDGTGKPVNGENKHHKSHKKIDAMKDIDAVPSNVQSARQEALLYVFEDNEAVIKMIMKGRSPTVRHVSRTHRVALDWLFDRINLDPKIQIEYIDTKNQLADILTKGNFTRDEWNHLLTLFNISHFSSTACTTAMAKRAEQGSGEERVTAKSRPMMNLTARTPSVVSSSASSNLGRTSYGYQYLGRSVASDDRTGKLVQPSRPDYTQEAFSHVTPSSDQDVDDTTLGKLLTEAHREYADYRNPEGVSVSQSSLSVASDRTGKLVGENSSNAQIRTLLDEQRQMIIEECCEKIGHHELQAARAEEERRILQEE